MWRWPVRVLEFLLGYSEMVVLWACIAMWESHYRTPLPAGTQWSLYAGAFIGISFWNWHKATARAEAAEVASPSGEPETPPRIFAEDEHLLPRVRYAGAPALIHRGDDSYRRSAALIGG